MQTKIISNLLLYTYRINRLDGGFAHRLKACYATHNASNVLSDKKKSPGLFALNQRNCENP